MTLRDLIKDDLEDVFLQVNEFAESVAYVPADGRQRRTVKALCEPDSAFGEDGSTLADKEQVAVLLSRDQDHAVTGGVATPLPGDRLVRTVDGEERTYTWTGVIQDDDAVAGRWLIFTRDVPYRIGGNR